MTHPQGVGSAPDVFTEYRKDGWPLCPKCGEDELYSHVVTNWQQWMKSKPPTLADCLAGDFTCYYCGWTSVPRMFQRL